MRLVYRRCTARKPNFKARRGQKICMYSLETSDGQTDLARLINVQAIMAAARAADLRPAYYGAGMYIEFPYGTTTGDPDGFRQQMDQLVLQHAGPEGGELVFVYDADSDLKFDAPVASQLTLEVSYYDYRWRIRVMGWGDRLRKVMFFDEARRALRDRGHEIDWGSDHVLSVSPLHASYLRPGHPLHIEQGTEIAQLVLPFLRVTPNGQRSFVFAQPR